MKAIVTGATGFIGSHLAQRLVQDGAEVRTIPRGLAYSELERNFCEFKPDVVFHLASLFIAEHKSTDIPALIESNVLFGTQILEAMTKSGCRALVNTGTSWQHFNSSSYKPVCLYAATKQAFEDIAKFYNDAHKIGICTLKLYDTFGPLDRRPKLISKLMEALRDDTAMDMSPGDQKVCLTHVNDVTEAFLTAANRLLSATNAPMESFSVPTKESLTLKELARLLEEISGKKLRVNFGARAYRAREVMEPWTSGEPLPDWSAKVTLKEGLAKLWTEMSQRHV